MCFVVVASGETSVPTRGPGVAADAGPRTGIAVVTATGASAYAIRRGRHRRCRFVVEGIGSR
jgi:hypothetical protein